MKLPLVLPEPSHAIRKLLETRGGAGWLKLNIAYEVSSVSAILELVRSGHGHAAVGAQRDRGLGQATAFRMRPLAESVLRSTTHGGIGAQAGHAAAQAGDAPAARAGGVRRRRGGRVHNRMR